MKNLITVLSFAFVLLFGMTNVTAQKLSQNGDRPEVVAKSKVADLTKQLDLTADQGRALFRAIVSKEMNYKKHINGKNGNDAKVVANKKKFDDALAASMKKTLTGAQYKKWSALKQ